MVAAISAPEDPVTLDKWARLPCVSVSTLRARCYAAGVLPKRSLDLARLLRAFTHAPAERCIPTDLLDAKDVRTAQALLVRAGVSPPVHDGDWAHAEGFLGPPGARHVCLADCRTQTPPGSGAVEWEVQRWVLRQSH